MAVSHKIAVIGAGVAGIIATRELQNEGHQVTTFEKSNTIGGLWVYNPESESDHFGQTPTRETIHSSVYSSLRTNLPRVLMSFSGFGFAEREYGYSRKFPGHEEVLSYLNDFGNRFGVGEVVRFNSEVVRVEMVGGEVDRWVVEWKVKVDDGRVELEQEEFDGVVVCNGHCSVPRVATIPGIERWPGKQTHSHNYRIPEPFTNQVVIVIGNGTSAFDISREISKVAKEVHVSSRSPDATFSKVDKFHNLWQHSSISDAKEDGTVLFEDGSSVQATLILHCTGYKYEFPFLNTNSIVSIDDNRVGPLYKHVFPPKLAPWLSFVGLPNKTIIFDLMEIQSKWIAKVLCGKICLPTTEKMMMEIEQYYQQMTIMGRPKHQTHYLTNSDEYLDDLASEAGVSPVEHWRKELRREIVNRVQTDDGYRDD